MSERDEALREIEQYEEMFALSGWKRLVADAEKRIYQMQADALEAPNWDTINRLRGRAETLAEICQMEEMVEMHKRSIFEADLDATV